jgi:hypothetical protein
MRGSVPHRPLARIKSIAPSLVAPVLQINKAQTNGRLYGWPKAIGRCGQAVGISGRAGVSGPGTPSPEPIQRKQVAREVRAVIAEDF